MRLPVEKILTLQKKMVSQNLLDSNVPWYPQPHRFAFFATSTNPNPPPPPNTIFPWAEKVVIQGSTYIIFSCKSRENIISCKFRYL